MFARACIQSVFCIQYLRIECCGCLIYVFHLKCCRNHTFAISKYYYFNGFFSSIIPCFSGYIILAEPITATGPVSAIGHRPFRKCLFLFLYLKIKSEMYKYQIDILHRQLNLDCLINNQPQLSLVTFCSPLFSVPLGSSRQPTEK